MAATSPKVATRRNPVLTVIGSMPLCCILVPREMFFVVGTPQGVVGTESGEGRPQSLNSQSNTVWYTNQSTGDHFCGLTAMEVSSVTALPIMAIKVKIKGSLLCIEIYSLLENGSIFHL